MNYPSPQGLFERKSAYSVILVAWQQRCAEAKEQTAEQARRVRLVEQKLDRLDDAFLYAQSIDILAFAERILPRAADLWVQASLGYKQRLQPLFFLEGIAFDGSGFNRTAPTTMLFSYLPSAGTTNERLVSRGNRSCLASPQGDANLTEADLAQPTRAT